MLNLRGPRSGSRGPAPPSSLAEGLLGTCQVLPLAAACRATPSWGRRRLHTHARPSGHPGSDPGPRQSGPLLAASRLRLVDLPIQQSPLTPRRWVPTCMPSLPAPYTVPPRGGPQLAAPSPRVCALLPGFPMRPPPMTRHHHHPPASQPLGDVCHPRMGPLCYPPPGPAPGARPAIQQLPNKSLSSELEPPTTLAAGREWVGGARGEPWSPEVPQDPERWGEHPRKPALT